MFEYTFEIYVDLILARRGQLLDILGFKYLLDHGRLDPVHFHIQQRFQIRVQYEFLILDGLRFIICSM